jgi:small-conductance mechanosensitive channel
MKKRSPYLLPFYLVSLGVLVFNKTRYNEITQNLDFPERLEHTFFRVLVASLVLEIARHLVLMNYKPANPKIKRDNFTVGIAHLARLIYTFMFVVVLLALFNISLKEAFSTLSLIAAAIVLVTRDYLANLISGMYITFSKMVIIGEQVSIAGNKGKILDITLSNVHLLNEDDDLMYIPNNKVFTNEIINYTRRELKKTSIDFEVDAMLVSDVDALEQLIVEALRPYSHEIQPDSYALKTTGVKKDCVQFKFQYILEEPLNKEVDKRMRRFVIREIVRIVNTQSDKF